MLGDARVRRLLEAPAPDALKGVRDRTILANCLCGDAQIDQYCIAATQLPQTNRDRRRRGRNLLPSKTSYGLTEDGKM